MIAKMKKLTFLIYYKEYEAFLKEIQNIGVLHVETAQEGFIESSPTLENKMRSTEHLHTLIEQLSVLAGPDRLAEGTANGACKYVADADKLNDEIHTHSKNQERRRRIVTMGRVFAVTG